MFSRVRVCVCVCPWNLGERDTGSWCGPRHWSKGPEFKAQLPTRPLMAPGQVSTPTGSPSCPKYKMASHLWMVPGSEKALGQCRADLGSVVCPSSLSASPLTQCRPSGWCLLPPLAVRLCSRPPFPFCFGQREAKVLWLLSLWRSQLCPPALVNTVPGSLFFHSAFGISVSRVLLCEP